MSNAIFCFFLPEPVDGWDAVKKLVYSNHISHALISIVRETPNKTKKGDTIRKINVEDRQD